MGRRRSGEEGGRGERRIRGGGEGGGGKAVGVEAVVLVSCRTPYMESGVYCSTLYTGSSTYVL